MGTDSKTDHGLWCLPEADLKRTTPLRARDLIVECFYQAQHETFVRSAKRLGRVNPSEDEIRRTVVAAVRSVFKDIGVNWDHPTTADLKRGLEALAHKAEAWGTPEDVVMHHGEQITRLLSVCQDAP